MPHDLLDTVPATGMSYALNIA